jgi:hypothetical protein
MARGKCPPGVLCIENITFVLLFIVFIVLGVIIYNIIINKNKQTTRYNETNRVTHVQNIEQPISNPYFSNPNAVLSNKQNDILLNPYAPPLKDNRFIDVNLPTKSPSVMVVGGGGFGGDIRGPVNIPIPVRTQGYNTDYRQVGLLTRNDGSETILPLFGRPLYSNRNKWQYYATTQNNNMIKLPISKNGKSCTGEYGCDELFNGDTLFVEGYKDAFNATIYETNQISYNPF